MRKDKCKYLQLSSIKQRGFMILWHDCEIKALNITGFFFNYLTIWGRFFVVFRATFVAVLL